MPHIHAAPGDVAAAAAHVEPPEERELSDAWQRAGGAAWPEWTGPDLVHQVTRGGVVVVVPPDTRKPRPAIVLRADAFSAHERLTPLPCTTQHQPWPTLRADLAPSEANALRLSCQP